MVLILNGSKEPLLTPLFLRLEFGQELPRMGGKGSFFLLFNK